MAEQTIKPVAPVNRPADTLRKKKNSEKSGQGGKPQPHPPKSKDPKGVIDTYA